MDDIATLLQRNDFDAVMERYELLQGQASDTAVANARVQILALARQLIEGRRFSLAEPLLQRFLVTAYRDVEAPVYKLDSLAVGDWQVNQLEIGVPGLGSQLGVDGLPGMNFLNHFQFFIDQNEAFCACLSTRRCCKPFLQQQVFLDRVVATGGLDQ